MYIENLEPAISAYMGAVFFTFLFFDLVPNLFSGKLAQALKSFFQLAAAVVVGFVVTMLLTYVFDLVLGKEPGRFYNVYTYSSGAALLWLHWSFIQKLPSPQRVNLSVCGFTTVLFLMFT